VDLDLDQIDQEDLEVEMLKEDLHLLKESLQKQKYKNRLEKLWKNFKGNLQKEKEQNTEEIKEMLTKNSLMPKLKHKF